MELLLNLLWLALALPAIWAWRRDPVYAGCSRAHSPLRASLLLMCVLAMLFPVVSASDDLHPMRPELEESSPSKRVAKQVNAASPTTGIAPPDSFLLVLTPDLQFVRGDETQVFVHSFIIPELTPLSPRGSRAPPVRFLG